MNKDTLARANALMKERKSIQRELDVWTKELTEKRKLGYLQGWNNDHATKLESNVPDELFDAFRTCSMNALRMRVFEIDAEIDRL